MSSFFRCPHCSGTEGLRFARALKQPMSCDACYAHQVSKEDYGWGQHLTLSEYWEMSQETDPLKIQLWKKLDDRRKELSGETKERSPA